MLSTLVFAILCGLGALYVWLFRPSQLAKRRVDAIGAVYVWPFLLAGCVATLLLMGRETGFGEDLTLSVKELRIPLAEAESDGAYFIVGQDLEKSDLVIGPYADASQSREAYRPEFDGLVEVRRSEGEWEVCARSVEPDFEANLPGMGVSFADKVVVGEQCRALGASSLKVLVSRLDPPDPETEDETVNSDTDFWELFGFEAEPEDEAARSEPIRQKRRHLYLSKNTNHVRVALKADEYLIKRVGGCLDAETTNGPQANNRLRLAPGGLHELDRGYRVPDNLAFSQLGQGGERPFLDPVKLGPVDTFDRLCSTGLVRDVRWPDADGQERIIMTSVKSQVPWWVLWVILGSTLFTLRLCRTEWQEKGGRAEASAVLALQWLLTLRLVMAIGGLPNDPSITLANILWPTLGAFVTVPLIAIGLLRPYREDLGAFLFGLWMQVPVLYLLIAWQLDWQWPDVQTRLLAFVPLGLAIVRLPYRSPQPLLFDFLTSLGKLALWVGSGFLSLTLALLRGGYRWLISALDKGSEARAWMARGRHLLVRLRDLCVWIGAKTRKLFLEQTDDGNPSDQLGLFQCGLLIGLAIVAWRVALALSPLNIRERFQGIPLIENIPVSLIYAPLAIVVMALMIVGFRRNPTGAKAVTLAGSFAIIFLAVGVMVRDLGVILIFALPVAFAISKLVNYPSKNAGAFMTIGRALLVMPILSPFLMLITFYVLFAEPVPAPYEDLIGHMQASNAWDANLVRLQRYLDPDFLIDVGNRSAMGVLDQAAQLEPIANSLIGAGYMTPSQVVPPLLSYQYSDNLLAVLVAWPFGRLGLFALLASLVIALVSMRPDPVAPSQRSWIDETSSLALMTLFWSGAYMALANLNLIPFTGRNFYLLAARSMGDLAEGLVLILLVALAASMRAFTSSRSGGAS